MSGRRLRVGSFLWAVDPLFLQPPSRSVDLLYLAGKGTVDEHWARQFLDASQVLCYRIARDCPHPYGSLDTEATLLHSNVTDLVRRDRLDALLITGRATPAIRAWAGQHAVTLIATGDEHQRHFENKLYFSRFLEHHRFPQPARQRYRAFDTDITIRGRAVIQEPESSNSEGTYVIRNRADIERLRRRRCLHRGHDYLLRKFVAGTPLGISVFVTPGVIALSALRRQCFATPTRQGSPRFTGIQWVDSTRIPPAARRRIDRVCRRMGRRLHERGFVGFAGIDFVLDRFGGIHLLECNPRLGSATLQMWQHPSLISNVPAATLFVEECLRPSAVRSTPQVFGLPDSRFLGSAYEVSVGAGAARPRGTRVRRDTVSGLYRYESGHVRFIGPDVRNFGDHPGEFIFYNGTAPGEWYRPNTLVAYLYANFPLYSGAGRVNSQGRTILRALSPIGA